MTPSARVQAAIGLVDAVIAAAKAHGAPADRIMGDWGKANRYAGSGDRREIRELMYRAIRACGPVPESGRAAMLRLAQDDPELLPLFDGSTHGPAPVMPDEPVAEGGVAPDWLLQRLWQSEIYGEEADALLDRAPLDIRVNTLKADRATLELPVAGEPLAAPQALRLPPGTPVESWEAYKDGRIEVQDHGSQFACEAVRAQPGEMVIDLCAGAGGKTLALAAAMHNRGHLVAADSDRDRLARLAPRAERAGAQVERTVLLDPGNELAALAEWEGKADAVLVDAPCSGSGTWRRNPEARWRLSKLRLERLTELQEHLLGVAARLVKPGGRLVYVVCSLLDEEGEEQVGGFLRNRPGWTARSLDLPVGRRHHAAWRLTPFHDGTDGFFFAQLDKPC